MIHELKYEDTTTVLERNVDRSMNISTYVKSDVLIYVKSHYKYIGSTNYIKSLAEKWGAVLGVSTELELTDTLPRLITEHIKDLIWTLQKETVRSDLKN